MKKNTQSLAVTIMPEILPTSGGFLISVKAQKS